MRNVKYWILVACALVLAPTAVAQEWFAWEWNSPPGTTWNYSAGAHTITIFQPGVYRFFGTLESRNGPLADIQNITAPGVTGAVTVSVIREGGQHLPGCTYLGGMDLTGATDSIVPELRVQNNAATVTGLTFRKLTGPLAVGGAITNPVNINTGFGGAVTCTSLGNFTATTGSGQPSITVTNTYAGTMTIGGFTVLRGLTLGGLTGSVTCNIDVTTNPVVINGDVSGTLDLVGFSSSATAGVQINGNITSSGTVIIRKSIEPIVEVTGDVAGTLDLRRGITDGDRLLHIGGSILGTGTVLLTESSGIVAGAIQIDKDVLGDLNITGTLHMQAGLGYVRVLGALGDSENDGHITVSGIQIQSPYSAYIAINYDGDGSCGHDLWHSGSTVVVGSTPYSGPNDAARVHASAASWDVGDCDGNAAVDFFDIDPFVALLGTPDSSMPGRNPGRLFQGDVDGDGDVDFFDIDPFVALLGTVYSCGGMELMMAGLAGEGAVEITDAATLAGILSDNTSDQNRPTLIAGVEQLAQTPPEGTQFDWPAVYEALTGN